MSGNADNNSYSLSTMASGKKWEYEVNVYDGRKTVVMRLRDVFAIEIDSIINEICERHASCMKIALDRSTVRSMLEFFQFREHDFDIDEEHGTIYCGMDIWNIDNMILNDTGVVII